MIFALQCVGGPRVVFVSHLQGGSSAVIFLHATAAAKRLRHPGRFSENFESVTQKCLFPVGMLSNTLFGARVSSCE
jgi:hypothetical protein